MRYLGAIFLFFLALTYSLFCFDVEYARAQDGTPSPIYLVGPGDIIKITFYLLIFTKFFWIFSNVNHWFL